MKHKRLIYSFVLLLLVIVGFATIISTNFGLGLVLRVASWVIPGKLIIGDYVGHLSQVVELNNCYFENDQIVIKANKLSFKPAFVGLIKGKLPLSSVHLNGINIVVKSQNTFNAKQIKPNQILAATTSFLSKFALLTELKLHDLQIKINEEDAVMVNKLNYDLVFDQAGLLKLVVAAILPNGTLSVQSAKTDQLKIEWMLQLKSTPIFAARELSSHGTVYLNVHGMIDKIIGNCKLVGLAYNKAKSKLVDLNTEINLTGKQQSFLKLKVDGLELDDLKFAPLLFNGNLAITNSTKGWFNFNGKISPIVVVLGSREKIKLAELGFFSKMDQNGFVLQTNQQDQMISLSLKIKQLVKFRDWFSNHKLVGQINWSSNNLAFMTSFLPKIKDVYGLLKLKITIAGSLWEPKFSGILLLSKVSLRIPDLNLSLKNLMATVNIDNGKLIYEGSIDGDKGRLILNGSGTINDSWLAGKLFIKGSNFLLANNKEYYLRVSPDLLLDFNRHRFYLTGNIDIPQAKIKPIDFTSYDFMPSELVYVDEQKSASNFINAFGAKLKISFGDQVYLDLLGLSGRVKGELTIIDNPHKVTTALGRIYIKDARYKIYAEQLKVARGELRFLGGALTNPQVYLEAVKKIKTITNRSFFSAENQELTVGARITGMLNNPKTTLFSEPTGLNNSDILSYLVLGSSVDTVSEGGGALLLQAATALNVGGSGVGSLVDSLKEKFNLSEFGITEEATSFATKEKSIGPGSNSLGAQYNQLATNTVFVLGKYLTPRIYVGYSKSFLDQAGVFKIKYYMGRYFSLRSESSVDGGGIDLIYSVER